MTQYVPTLVLDKIAWANCQTWQISHTIVSPNSREDVLGHLRAWVISDAHHT